MINNKSILQFEIRKKQNEIHLNQLKIQNDFLSCLFEIQNENTGGSIFSNFRSPASNMELI